MTAVQETSRAATAVDVGPAGTRQKSVSWRSIAWRIGKLLLTVIIGYFLVRQVDADTINQLRDQPKRWDLLAIALLWVVGAHLISFIRWWQLVQSLNVPFTLAAAIRAGFLGTALNLVTLGGVGGDVFKAIVAGRSARDKLPEIFASVILDRVVGLIGLIIVTAVALEAFCRGAGGGDASMLTEDLQWVRAVSGGVAIGSLIGMVALAVAGNRLPIGWLRRLPVIGPTAARMAAASHLLHGRPGLLGMQLALSCGVHLSLVFGFYMTSIALYDNSPGLLPHLVAVPPGFAAAAIPLTPGGVFLLEGTIASLMQSIVGRGEEYAGVLVVILGVYRVHLLITAAIGGLYYLLGFGRLAASERTLAAELSHGSDASGAGI